MNKLDFEGRTAIVTGGAKGIGYATAERLLGSGAAVVLWDRDAPRLEKAKSDLSAKGRVRAVTVDVTDAEAVSAAMDATLEACPAIDAMIANAGIAGIIKSAWDYSLEEWDRLIVEDLTSVFLCCRAVVPHMLERGYGRIVVVSSIAGLEGAPTNAAYTAAKAGAIGYTKALGKELAKTGVIANCVAPSGIETELLADVTREYLDTVVLAKMPIGRLGQPAEAAALIAWLASEDCSFCAGAVFDLSGGRAVY
jgi:3-oxoacyl-[acyl-carrier protein] reductase